MRFSVLICLLTAVVITENLREAAAAPQQRNVLLITADDLGLQLSCYGERLIRTPNIDRLAAEGRRFADAHSVSAVCTPSRYALLTGEYPLRASGGRGVWGPAPITSPLIIDTGKTTIADVFKSVGYDTAAKLLIAAGDNPHRIRSEIGATPHPRLHRPPHRHRQRPHEKPAAASSATSPAASTDSSNTHRRGLGST